MSDEDFEEDELITIKLPRAQYLILKEILKEREAFKTYTGKIKASWIWVIGGSIVGFIALWDKIHLGFFK
jgi:hypothetical protein